ncbi:hypothetical protein F5Y02DRAFT_397068 [Annulohypoxylon stygium]|nr:hypothetical protein F5Y02DRAFT_397068 [Annulohypoxylon stygium]
MMSGVRHRSWNIHSHRKQLANFNLVDMDLTLEINGAHLRACPISKPSVPSKMPPEPTLVFFLSPLSSRLFFLPFFSPFFFSPFFLLFFSPLCSLSLLFFLDMIIFFFVHFLSYSSSLPPNLFLGSSSFSSWTL